MQIHVVPNDKSPVSYNTNPALLPPPAERPALYDRQPRPFVTGGMPGAHILQVNGIGFRCLFKEKCGEPGGTRLLQVHITATENKIIQLQQPLAGCFLQIIQLNGLLCNHNGLGKHLHLERSVNLLYLPSQDTRIWLRAGQSYEFLQVHYPNVQLQSLTSHYPSLGELLHKVIQENPATLDGDNRIASRDILELTRQLQEKDYPAPVFNLYLASVSTTLLLAVLERFEEPVPTVYVKLHPDEIELLYEAKTYLLSHMEDAPTIPQLSRKVGLSEFKLKNGFKQVYGMAIHDFFQDARMHHALELLSTTGMTVDEIGMLTGYTSAPNFIKAFKNFFGYTPGHVRTREVKKEQ